MVKYGKECKQDSDCSSKICEMTYTDTGRPIGRKCVIQPPKYGKSCVYNKDCISHRCVATYDDRNMFIGKKCAVIKGLVLPKRGWPFDNSGVPDMIKTSKRHEEVRKEELVLSNAEKVRMFQSRGPVAEFVVLVMEIVIKLITSIVDILWSMWKTIFDMLYELMFGYIQFDKIFGFWNKYTCMDTTVFRYIVTLLFPPFGVFMKKGISGFGYILLCCILTMFFYFPGLMYAIIVMSEGKIQCPNKVQPKRPKK